jgi:cytochrome c biogenesis factor
VRSGVIQSVHSFAFNGPQTCGLLVFFSALMGIMSMGIARRLRMDDFLHDEHKPKYIITKYLLWFQMGLLSLFFVIIVLGLIWMAITGQDIDRSFFDTLAYGGFWLAIGPLWVVSLKGAHKWRRVGAALVAGMTLCALLYKALPMPLSLYQHIMFWGVGVLSVGSIVALWWGSTVRKNVRLAHSGLLLFFWAVSLTMVGQYQETILLKPGKSLGVYGMQVSLLGLRTLKPDNKSYQSIQAKVRLWTPRSAMIFYPERRLYAAQQSLQTEIALHNGPLGVYQVMLGDQHKDGWSLHISYHFMVQWIWLAGLLMIAGVMRSVCPTWLCLFKNL